MRQKALNLFNAALVTPTYYVFFTSATIITSSVLFRGFKGTPVSIVTVIMGFLQICAGVVLLQMSKSAKDVPDAAVFKGDLDQVREIAEVEQPESEPKADAIRGTAALIRRLSTPRQKWEQEEARRLREDQMKDHLEPLRENEIVEWDGLRRRKTIIGQPGTSPVIRRKTIHPPLGMSHFPDQSEEDGDIGPGFFENLRNRAQSVARKPTPQQSNSAAGAPRSPLHPVALTEIKLHPSQVESPIMPYGPGSFEDAQERIYGLPPGKRKEQDQQGALGAHPSPRSKPLPEKPSPSPISRPPHEARRQFSFTNFLRPSSRTPDTERPPPLPRPILQHRASSASHEQKKAMKNATEEERLGLVKGDSHIALLQHDPSRSPERPHEPISYSHPASHSPSSSIASVDDHYPYQYPLPSQHPQSYSDEENGWQMTNSASPPHTMPHFQNPIPTLGDLNNRRIPDPARAYQPQPATRNIPTSPTRQRPTPVPGTMVGGGLGQGRVTPAVSGPFQTSSTSQPQTQGANRGHVSRQESGEPHQARLPESPGATDGQELGDSRGEDDGSSRRFEEQSKREREERRLRATGRRQSWKPPGPEGGSFV